MKNYVYIDDDTSIIKFSSVLFYSIEGFFQIGDCKYNRRTGIIHVKNCRKAKDYNKLLSTLLTPGICLADFLMIPLESSPQTNPHVFNLLFYVDDMLEFKCLYGDPDADFKWNSITKKEYGFDQAEFEQNIADLFEQVFPGAINISFEPLLSLNYSTMPTVGNCYAEINIIYIILRAIESADIMVNRGSKRVYLLDPTSSQNIVNSLLIIARHMRITRGTLQKNVDILLEAVMQYVEKVDTKLVLNFA